MAQARPVDRRPHQPPHLHQQAAFPHQPQDAFAVDRPIPSPQLSRHAAITVAGEFHGDLLDGRTQGRVFPPASGIVVGAGGQAGDLTQQAHIEVLGGGGQQASLVRGRQLSIVDNFFAAANSTVS